MKCLFTARLHTACVLHFFPPSIIIGPVGVGRIREAASCKLIAKWALFRFHYSPAGSTINCRLISFGGGEIKQCVTFCHCVVCSSSFVRRDMVKKKKNVVNAYVFSRKCFVFPRGTLCSLAKTVAFR